MKISSTTLPRPPTLSRWRPPPASGRILIVDDDPTVQTLVALVLGRAGYRVTRADDGEAGWDALRTEHFDLLITDHEMPRLTGLDLLRRVRTALRNLPVILASGRIPWHDPALLPLLRPGLALAKPFLPVVLLEKVRGVLAPAAGASETDHDQTGLNSFPGGSLPQIARARG